MPSTDPPSLQVIQTVVGLAQAAEVHLIVQRGPTLRGLSVEDSRKAIEAYYGLKLPQRLHLYLLNSFDYRIGGLHLFWNLPFIVRVAASIVKIMRSSGTADALLVRNLRLAQFLLRHRRLLRLPRVIFETHEVFVLSSRDEMERVGKLNLAKSARLERLERYVYEQSDGLICITSHLASMIRDRYRIDKPILVVPDGVDLDAIVPETGLHAPSSPTVLYLGSLHHWKGIDTLLAAIQRLPGVRARIIGGNDETIRRYSRLAHELGIEDRVSLEGYVQPADRFRHMADANVYVLPLKQIHIASYFTSPLKLFEYMAAGRPIVASDLPAVREILTDGVNAVLVEPESPDALAQGIRRVLENPALGERLAAQASVDVRRYTWEERSRSLIEFADRLHH